MGKWTIRKSEQRVQNYETLQAVADENTISGALDTAASTYVDLVDTRIPELLREAESEGSLTVVEIAEILDSPSLSVEATVEYDVEP